MAQKRYPRTLEEVAAWPSDILSPAHICRVMHLSQYEISCTAKNHPEQLLYPVEIHGEAPNGGRDNRRVKIPKWKFLDAMGYRTEEDKP